MRKNTRGNALFLILIAVALFAGLAFAVTKSNRNGDGSVDKEEMELAVSQSLQYMALIRATVQRMILTGSCTDKTIRFWHPDRVNAGVPGGYGDGSNPDCEIFDNAGGGLEYQTRPAALETATEVDDYMVLSVLMQDIGQNGNILGSDGQGLYHDLIIALNVPRQACISANRKMGITNTGGEPPHISVSPSTTFVSPGQNNSSFPSAATGGHAAGGTTVGAGPATAAEIAGFPVGCFSRNSSAPGNPIHYVLYSTLLER